MKNRKQEGTVLISALLITVISVLLATAIIVSLRVIIREAQLITQNDQMQLILQGVNDWAAMAISDHPDITTVKPLELKIKGISVVGKIHAQQSLFNLNSLVHE